MSEYMSDATCPQCHTVHTHRHHSSPSLIAITTNRPPSCTVKPNGLSSNSSSPQPRAAHALMHTPSNIGWRSSAASPNSSSPQPRAAHAVMEEARAAASSRGTTLKKLRALLGERGVGPGSADRRRALAHDDRLVQVAGQSSCGLPVQRA
jgi:hypothetical protein